MRSRLDELEGLFEEQDGIDRETVRDGVLYYRTRTIRSGDMLECMAYPIIGDRRKVREARSRITGEAQQRVNRRNLRRRLVRLAMCNFTERAVFVTLTYEGDPGEEEAEKELDRYLVRLRTAARKQGNILRYIGSTEVSSRGRVHHHLLLEGVDRETAERKWKRGFANGRKYQRNPEGFKGLVMYITKWNSTVDGGTTSSGAGAPPSPEGKAFGTDGGAGCGHARRRIRTSKGMIQPRETESNHRMTRARMERAATQLEEGAREALEKAYPGYVVRERPEIRRSEWLPGAYMYAVLWKQTG